MKHIILIFLSVLSVTLSPAQLHTAKIFSDSMVLQRNARIPVWGWASKGENISVQFNSQTKTTTADDNGKWRVDLEAEKEGGPFQLSIRGNSTIVYKDVLVGDVWLCSGQSNMEWLVRNSNNYAEEMAMANLPLIRHTKINLTVAAAPQQDLNAGNGWQAATPANVGNFTAVGYFFAKRLYEELHVPIGLINSTWGGTNVETWISHEALQNNNEFKEMMAGFPVLNLDSIAMVRKQETIARLTKAQGGLPSADETKKWKDPSFNTGNWQSMHVPGLWEPQSLKNLDGIVWLRREFTVDPALQNAGAELMLGMVDDNDETYINGVKIGSTTGYNQKRLYSIPPGVLHSGKNLIAVRVEDTGGGGGIYGDANDVRLAFTGSSIPLAGDWQYRVESVIPNTGVDPNSYPTLLFNSMINPLIPYAIKGAIWYQGESNAGRAFQYRTAFPLMITDWRNRWKQGDFPFYFVQLSSFNANGGTVEKGSEWAELREAQALTLSYPNTGMAVTTDIGEPKDIHPRNKQDVGKRLAAVALNKAYGRSNEYSGPVFKSVRMEGNKAIIDFDHKGGGLITTDPGGWVKGFAMAGDDKKFVPATAIIEGDRIVVTAAGVSTPVAVRYAWADFAGEANLYNLEKFPAVPFRTDQWTGITDTKKYRIANQ